MGQSDLEMSDRTLVALMAAVIYTRGVSVEVAVQAAKDILYVVESPERRKQEAEKKRLHMEAEQMKNAHQWWDYVEGKEK